MSKATIKQVAKEAGVSTATVSRVLTGSSFVSDEVKAVVMAAVNKLNYQPNALARGLKQDRTYTIGIVLPDIANTFFMTVCKGIEEILHEQGYHLIFASSDEDRHKEQRLLHLLQEKRVDAIVLATTGGNEELIGRIVHFGTPVLLLDRAMSIGGVDPQIDRVTEDNFAGAYQLTQSILVKGHTRIGVVNGFLDVSTGYDRYQGYLHALQEAGVAESSTLVYDGEFSVEGGMRAAAYFMEQADKPTAIISFNNQMSFGVLQSLVQQQVKMPEDLMLASYGAVDAALLLQRPGIVMVRQQPYEMGLQTGEILLKRLEDKKYETYEAQSKIFQPIIEWLS